MPTKYTSDMLKEAVSSSESFAEVLRKLNTGTSGSLHSHIKQRIKDLKIDYTHFTHRNTKTSSGKKKEREEVLVLLPSGSKRTTRPALLRALMEHQVSYACALCPLTTEWQGKNLNLHIDHTNGNKLDNRLENLRFLCPNCHSQQETSLNSLAYNPYIENSSLVQKELVLRKQQGKMKLYDSCPKCSGEKRKQSSLCQKCSQKTSRPHQAKIVWPDVKQLIQEIKATSYVETGRKLGVSDNAIRKYLTNRNINLKTLEFL